MFALHDYEERARQRLRSADRSGINRVVPLPLHEPFYVDGLEPTLMFEVGKLIGPIDVLPICLRGYRATRVGRDARSRFFDGITLSRLRDELRQTRR